MVVGKPIFHFTPWDNRVRFFCSNSQMLKKKLIFKSNNILSNGVNKILEKLGEARLRTTCLGESQEILNG